MPPSELRLTTRDHVVIYLNDQLVGEVAVGMWTGRDALLARVGQARCLERMPQYVREAVARIRTIPDIADHVNTRPAAKQAAYVRGLLDGLDRKTVPYPGGDPQIPPVPPEGTIAYLAGHRIGETLARMVEIVERAEAEWREAQKEATRA